MREAAPNSTHEPGRTIEGIDEHMYRHLRCRATAILRKERPERRMEPSDLVHEAFLRLARRKPQPRFHDEAHLIAVATIVMRRILIDCARSASSPTRYRWVSLDSGLDLTASDTPDTLPFRDILRRLAEFDERLFAVVRMRFYWGLEIEEIASALSLSSRTVKRDWTAARGWLRQKIGDFSGAA